MPVYKSYIEFRTQLKRPEIQKVLSKQDSCTKNIDFNHSYEAVDEKTWIQANNTHLFDNQLSHETYYPGKQTVHMNEPQQKPFYFLEWPLINKNQIILISNNNNYLLIIIKYSNQRMWLFEF